MDRPQVKFELIKQPVDYTEHLFSPSCFEVKVDFKEEILLNSLKPYINDRTSNHKMRNADTNSNSNSNSKAVLSNECDINHVSVLPTDVAPINSLQRPNPQSGEKPYKCNVCEFTIAYKPNLLRHFFFNPNHISEKPYNCDKNQEVTLHVNEKPYKCDQCGLETKHKNSWQQHLKSHQEKPFACGDCEFRTNNKKNLKLHINDHKGKKPYACDFCDYRTANKRCLWMHKKSHGVEKPYSCITCKFQTNHRLTLHIKAHIGEKPYKCNECGFRTSLKIKLRLHMKFHVREKPYGCNLCKFELLCVSDLRRHVLRHFGETSYMCSECDFRTGHKGNLQLHLKLHIGENHEASNRLERDVHVQTREKPNARLGRGYENPEEHHLQVRLQVENGPAETSSCLAAANGAINEIKADELGVVIFAHNVVDQAEEVVKIIIRAGWRVCHFTSLPDWLQDNDFLTHGHRPPLQSFGACFKSIFSVHTETGNIWTHMLGCIGFICIAAYLLIDPNDNIQMQEKIVFGIFLACVIICLGFSFSFHTLICHSPIVCKVFSKLDYCGISILMMGSVIVWLYYGFYCHFRPKLIYLVIVCSVGTTTILVSLLDRFAAPGWRPFRAGIFIVFGLSSIVPVIHYGFVDGWSNKVSLRSVGWLSLMAVLYIGGAMLYALRIPERIFPGKFDIWFHSHQIFHVFVIGAASVHLYGVSLLATHRLNEGLC